MILPEEWFPWRRVSAYLLVGVLLLQHHRQPLQERPHAGRRVEADHALPLQRRAARRQHVVGRHELFGAVHDQNVLEMGQTQRKATETRRNRKSPMSNL